MNRVQLCTRQIPKPKHEVKLRNARLNIVKILRIREEPEFSPSWEAFFDSIPTSNESIHASYENILLSLHNEFGGNIKLRELHFTTFKR